MTTPLWDEPGADALLPPAEPIEALRETRRANALGGGNPWPCGRFAAQGPAAICARCGHWKSSHREAK